MYRMKCKCLRLGKIKVSGPASRGGGRRKGVRADWIRNGGLRVFIGTAAIPGRVRNDNVKIKTCEGRKLEEGTEVGCHVSELSSHLS